MKTIFDHLSSLHCTVGINGPLGPRLSINLLTRYSQHDDCDELQTKSKTSQYYLVNKTLPHRLFLQHLKVPVMNLGKAGVKNNGAHYFLCPGNSPSILAYKYLNTARNNIR